MKPINLIKKYKFTTLSWIIIIMSNIWYWGFGLWSGDLVQIVCGICWIIMILILPTTAMDIDWMIYDSKTT